MLSQFVPSDILRLWIGLPTKLIMSKAYLKYLWKDLSQWKQQRQYRCRGATNQNPYAARLNKREKRSKRQIAQCPSIGRKAWKINCTILGQRQDGLHRHLQSLNLVRISRIHLNKYLEIEVKNCECARLRSSTYSAVRARSKRVNTAKREIYHR